MATSNKKPSKSSSSGKKTSSSSSTTKRTKETKGTTIGDITKSEVPVAPEVERVTPSTIDPTVAVKETKLDTTQADEWRRQQQELAKGLEDTISGAAPSLAQLQMQKATEQNVAQQFALARSQRASNNPALAMRQAQVNAAQVGQAAAMDSAIARIQEQRSAQNMLNQVLGTGRAGDIQLSTAQGDITSREALANALAENERIKRQAELNQAASLANANAANQRGDLSYNASVNAAQQYADAMNQKALQQANINSQILQQQISSGATTRAASIAAGASNYSTDAANYRFNMDNLLQQDQNAYTNRYNEIGAENNRNQGRGSQLRQGIANAGAAATQMGSMGGGQEQAPPLEDVVRLGRRRY